MAEKCDNKSAAVAVWKDDKLFMIERKKYNFGYALPAGHEDGDNSETAARRELQEETGLKAAALEKKLNLTLPNPCQREGGDRHEWTIFEAKNWSGEIKPSADETKSWLWTARRDILKFSERLEKFAEAENITLDLKNLSRLVEATNKNPLWRNNPGLEPPMYFLFKKLNFI